MQGRNLLRERLPEAAAVPDGLPLRYRGGGSRRRRRAALAAGGSSPLRHAMRAVFGLLAILVSLKGLAAADRVPCADVVSLATRHTRQAPTEWLDVSKVAEKLGASGVWVEHCLRVYGRRYRRPGLENAEKQERRLERYETDEHEEPTELEHEEPGELEKTQQLPPARRLKVGGGLGSTSQLDR